jgi:integrase
VLTAKKMEALRRKPGRYLDGGDFGRSLYLQVTSGGASWLLRFERNGRERWMGLGSLADFSLKEARQRARAARQLLADGVDPLDQKRAAKAAQLLDAMRAMTFEEAAKQFFNQHSTKWRNAKHRAQFISTLEDYAFPTIGSLAVANIDTAAVLRVVEPIWMTKTETANRVRGRIEAVLDWAAVRSLRSGDNPARWRNHLANVLPARGSKVNHPALAYADIPQFMSALRSRDSVSARALEFTILTAARTGAVIGGTWSEIDLANKIWKVPPERAGAKVYGNKPRSVPLSDRAIAILKALPREEDNPFVFIGGKKGLGLSNAAMAELMKDMAFPSTSPGRLAVPHGFRSTFKDWCSETTNYPNHVSEAALWHGVADEVEAAYRRGDLLTKRRRLMRDWARYCSSVGR